MAALLRRRPGVERQRGLPRTERRRNVARAFTARGTAPARVCLVDDVYTTGSTATACATALRRAGARRVDVVCLAQGACGSRMRSSSDDGGRRRTPCNSSSPPVTTTRATPRGEYAEAKLSKLDRRLHDLTLVEVTFSREHNPSIADDHVVEAVVHTKGPNLVARESATTYEAAIDKLLDKLERQVERYRDKRTVETRRRGARKRRGGRPERGTAAAQGRDRPRSFARVTGRRRAAAGESAGVKNQSGPAVRPGTLSATCPPPISASSRRSFASARGGA